MFPVQPPKTGAVHGQKGKERSLRKLIAGSSVHLIPLTSGQLYFRGFCGMFEAVRVGGADDDLHFGRITQKPGVGYGVACDAVLFSQGDNKELLLIPDAVHTDLYDRTDIIPFDKLVDFFRKNLK